MEKETIAVLLEFMKRVTLQGSEVPAFNKVISELNKQLQDEHKP